MTLGVEAPEGDLTLEAKLTSLPKEALPFLYTEAELDRMANAFALQRGRPVGEGERRLQKIAMRIWQADEILSSFKETGALPASMIMTRREGSHRMIDNHAWLTISVPELPENTQVFDLELQEQPLREVVASVAGNQCTQTAFPPSYSQMEKPITIYGYDLTCDKVLEVFEALSSEQTAQVSQ